jgi:hypothetical protein
MGIHMSRAEPSPYEEIMIDNLLESGNGQKSLLETIQQLSKEQYALRLRQNQHLMSNHAVTQRLHKITYQLQLLWAEVRRVRATRRVLVEEALGVDPVQILQHSPIENEVCHVGQQYHGPESRHHPRR